MPKTGGNRLAGSFYESTITKGMVGDNYSDELKARGLTTPGKLFKLWDINVGVGGPIKKDVVWFFFQFRDQGSHRTIPGMFANKNMGDPTKWTYERDTTRPAVAAGSWRNAALRLTVQPTPRNKFNVFWDQQVPCQGAGVLGSDAGCRQSGDDEIICGAAGASNPPCSATAAPEIGTYLSGYGQRVQQATWTSPIDQQAAARGRLRHLLEPVGRHGAPRQQLHAARGRDRAVHVRLPGQRRHRRPAVPVRHLPAELPGHDSAGADRPPTSPAPTA